MKYSKPLRVFISVLLISFLIYKVNPAKVGASLANLSFLIILFILLHYFTTTLMNSLNLYVFLRATQEKFSFKRFLSLNWYALGLGQFLPGKVGEIAIVKMLNNRYQTPMGKTISMYLLDKSLTLFLVAVISVYGIVKIFPILSIWNYFIVGVVIIVILSLIILSNSKTRIWIRTKILRKYENKFKGFSKGFRYIFRRQKFTLILNISFTLTRFIITAFLFKLMFLEYQINVPLITLIVINAISLVALFVPFTFSGIGIKESVVVFLFSILNYDVGIVATIYLLTTSSYLIINGLVVFVNLNKKKHSHTPVPQ